MSWYLYYLVLGHSGHGLFGKLTVILTVIARLEDLKMEGILSQKIFEDTVMKFDEIHLDLLTFWPPRIHPFGHARHLLRPSGAEGHGEDGGCGTLADGEEGIEQNLGGKNIKINNIL